MGAVVARVLKIMEYPFFSRLSIKKIVRTKRRQQKTLSRTISRITWVEEGAIGILQH